MIVKDYKIDGTEFEICNCPAYIHEKCKIELSIGGNCKFCREITDCILKSHLVNLSALISVANRNPNSAEVVGARACFNDFLVKQ